MKLLTLLAALIDLFHIFTFPLQSGSDTILKRMKRRYLRDVYVSRVERIKEKMPDGCPLVWM